MMKQGLVIILVCVFANQSSAKTYARGGNKLSRFLNDNARSGTIIKRLGGQCGHCLHGTCTYQSHNGIVLHNYCTCDHGWHGEQCDQPDSHYDPCHQRCGDHGTCVQQRPNNGYPYWNCKCDHGWHGAYCTYQLTNTPSTTKQTSKTSTTTKSTTTLSSTIPTVLPKSSAVPMSQLFRCSHRSTITAIAFQTHVTNKHARQCPSGNHDSHEAFVLTECNVVQTPSSWQQGLNVLQHCDHIPNLTPIASFDNGHYSSVGSLSGVFLGCTNNGFKIAFQTCGQMPQISELHTGGSFSLNPIRYYTIA